jgi:ferric-dicitrate binding protein FerR (iron transport regulator)
MIITKEKLTAFFEDRCAHEEAEAIHRYLRDNPQLLHEFFPEEEWMSFQHTADRPIGWSEKIWDTIQVSRTPVSPTRIRSIRVLKIAAVFIGVSIAVFLLFRQLGEKREQPQALAVSQPANKDTVVVNQGSSLRKLELVDGSTVVLSPASQLRLHWDLEQNKRTVWLSGEALFQIATDEHRPFTVFTSKFSTTVLGTSFRIKAYPGTKTSSVQLLNGKVMVRNLAFPAETLCLLAGQACNFDNEKCSLDRRPTGPSAGSTHQLLPVHTLADEQNAGDDDEEIQFKNQPLPAVLTTLSQSYHTPVHFNAALLYKRKFTGSIRKDQSIAIALKTIALLNDLIVEDQDSVYNIRIRH